MAVQVEHLDTHEARLSIDVEQADMEKARKAVAARLSKDYRFPGFRPGKVPVSVLISAFGEESFNREVADELAKMLYSKALDESQVNPYAPGALEELKMDPPRLIARVPKMPIVDLKDYKSIRIPYTEPTVAEDEIQSQLNAIADDNAIVTALERPAQRGDWIEGRIVAYNEDNEALFDLEEKAFELDEEIEKTLHLAGLVAHVEGMSDGSNRSVSMKVDDSEEDEALRGKEVRVEITVDRVNKREVPAIDDTLAQTVGAYENLGQLREKITSQLMDYKTQLARNEYQDQVVGAFESLSEITLPPKYMDDRVDEALEDFKERVKRDDKLDFPDWLKLNGMTEEQARETLTESVTKQARVNLVLGGVRNAEDTKLDAGELDAALERQRELAKASGVDLSRTIRNAAYRESLGSRLLTDKVLKRMMDIAQGKVKVVETATAEAAAPAG